MTTDGRTTGRWFYAVAGLVVLLVAGVISRFASSDPDGLERVAADQGIDAQAVEHTGRLGYDGAGGIVGVAVVLLLALALTRALRRRSAGTPRGR